RDGLRGSRTPLHQVGPAGREGTKEYDVCLRVGSRERRGGGLPFAARLGYPTSACAATSEKFPGQVAGKFSLDSARARGARARARSGEAGIPRAPDREREAGILDVHEHRVAIGREARAGELALARVRVSRDAVAASLRRDADDVILAPAEREV